MSLVFRRKHKVRPAVPIRTYAGSSAGFNASATWRHDGAGARNDSEMARVCAVKRTGGPL